MANSREEILRVENLKHYFISGRGKNRIVVKAVDDISFSIFKGEVFSLVGESGCGKTTTGRAIIRLYNATGGNVYFHDKKIITDVNKAKELYKEEKISLEEYKQIKQDQKFEKIITPEMRELADSINDEHPLVVEKIKEYNELIVEAEKRIVTFTKELEDIKSKLVNDKKNEELLQNLEKATAGLKAAKVEIKLNNLRIKNETKRQKRIALRANKDIMAGMQMIFQDPIASLNPRMTVREIIAEGLRIAGEKDELLIDTKVKSALTIVGLVPEHAARYPHEFSGGQRQRIGIARALISNPSFIIADEPISALDVSIRAQVINLLNDLRENFGVTILFIAHDLSVVKYFSDRVAVMYYGKIVEMGEKELVFDNPLHPYTLSLLDSIPLPDPLFEKKRGAIKRYYPSESHDYSVEGPTLQEVEPGHFVLCNTEEFEKHRKLLAENKK
jgi:oligopeptide transport system ATP-binding protein